MAPQPAARPAAAAAVGARSDAAWAERLTSPEALLDYMVAHRRDVSVVAYDLDAPGDGLRHGADVPQPLASTLKALVLAAYAEAVVAGRLAPDERVPLADVEAFHVAGTDGGAHPEAMAEIRARGGVDAAGRLALADVVGAMMKQSDNAATDYVIARVGRKALEAMTARLALGAGVEAPAPVVGGLAAWLAAPIGPDRAAFVERAWAAHARLARDPAEAGRVAAASAAADLPPERLRECARFSAHGTAGAYARLMAEVWRPTRLKPAEAAVMRGPLEWPMAFPGVKDAFQAWGRKGGSLPHVLTGANYVVTKDGRASVAALFFRDLPAPIYARLAGSGLQQEVEIALAISPKLRARLAERLAQP